MGEFPRRDWPGWKETEAAPQGTRYKGEYGEMLKCGRLSSIRASKNDLRESMSGDRQ